MEFTARYSVLKSIICYVNIVLQSENGSKTMYNDKKYLTKSNVFGFAAGGFGQNLTPAVSDRT